MMLSKKLFFISMILIWMNVIKGHAMQSTSHTKTIDQGWQFRQVGSETWYPAAVPGTVHTDLYANQLIGDPFYRTNERDLQWIDKIDWEYRTNLHVDRNTLSKDRLELQCDGLDTYADVYLNNNLLLTADNMFRTWKAECKSLLRIGDNELRIYFHSPVKVDLPKLEELGYALPAVNDQSENGELGDKKISVFARKAGYHYGWDWGPRFVTSGIWRPIHLLAWDKVRIDDIRFIQKQVNASVAELKAIIEIESIGNHETTIRIRHQAESDCLAQTIVQLHDGVNRIVVDFEIANPKLWWCNGLGASNRYTIVTELEIDHLRVDENETTVGIRNLRVVRNADEAGKSFYFELNGVPVFAKGANYIPNDNFLPRVTAEQYEAVVKAAADANMNMLRVWGGGIYENDIFYELCDRYGIMIWHDFMFACSMYPGDDHFVENVKQEAIENVRRIRNHPCLALWCGNNEIDAAWSQDTPGGWGWKERNTPEIRDKLWSDYEKIFHQLLPQVVQEYDPGTFYWPSSPLADWNKRASYESTSGDIHYWGVWHGSEPFENFKLKIGRFMSEYGFQSFPELKTIQSYTLPEDWDINSEVMAAHQRSGIGNKRIKSYMDMYYRDPKDFQSQLYVGQVLQAEGIKMAIEAHRRKMPYCMGSLYWQLNDCWPVSSWSSTDYFGRWKALHYFAREAFKEVLVSPEIDDQDIKVFVVSDKQEPFPADLRLEIIDFYGKPLWSQSIAVYVMANSSQSFFTANVKKFTRGMDKGRILLRASLWQNDRNISQNVAYFTAVKDIKLSTPKITQHIVPHENGYLIQLSTDRLAKNVYLSHPSLEGFFSDNYFDLLPGESITLKFHCQEKALAFEKGFGIMSLRDTYY